MWIYCSKKEIVGWSLYYSHTWSLVHQTRWYTSKEHLVRLFHLYVVWPFHSNMTNIYIKLSLIHLHDYMIFENHFREWFVLQSKSHELWINIQVRDFMNNTSIYKNSLMVLNRPKSRIIRSDECCCISNSIIISQLCAPQ